MAANQLRDMYACIGFNNGADDNIVDVQQINTTTELGYLNDEDVVNLCKMIHRPGGHLPNPAFVAGGARMPVIIPYYAGIMVSQRAESNLQLAVYTVMLLYWSNPVSQVLRAMAFKRTTRGRSNFGELMTAKIS
jgi:hypothetical protein